MTKIGALIAALGLPLCGWADSLSPSTFSATLGVGESVTIHKTLTVSSERPTTAQADVMFLFDTTGSMGSVIAAAKSAASTILSNTSSLGDVRFAVGHYKDIGDGIPYAELSDITTGATAAANSAAAQAAINTLSASGGGDTPESNLTALQTLSSSTAWRAGSTRIVVWFGDAPGHEGGAYPTRAATLAALDAQNVIVNAISYTSGGGLNAAAELGGGQATFLTSSTGGTLINAGTPGTDAATITAAINAAITASFATYSSVSLDLSEAPAGVAVTASPLSYTGSFDRSITRTFGFDVTFTGLTPGTYDFNIYGKVGAGRVASELDHIVVGGGGGAVPEPSTYGAIAGLALCGLVAFRRMKAKKAAQVTAVG